MFGKLAYEKHKATVNADHRILIREAALDINSVSPSEDDDIQVDELDSVMATDAEAVSPEELDDLESKIGDVVTSSAGKDVTVMTRDEIEKHVADTPSLTLNDLNK